MQGISFLEDIDMMVLSSIIVAVILAFILVVIVFMIKSKSQYENIKELKKTLAEKRDKVLQLEESLNEVRILNASQLQEISQHKEVKEKFKSDTDALNSKLNKAHEKLEALSAEMLSLEKEKSKLSANIQNAKDTTTKLEEALSQATKRNEFWVEQMTEVRTKYEALKLKVK